MLSHNALLLYVQKAGGWRSASVLLRVYARWVPEWIETVAAAKRPQPRRNRRPWRGSSGVG